MKKLLSVLLVLSISFSMCAFSSVNKSSDVKNVERLIAAIGEVSLEREKYVTDAEHAFAELLEADKDLVENRADLFTAREALDRLLEEKAAEVIQLIAAIGTVNINNLKSNEIVEAEAAYAALPESAKPLVENYDELQAARYSLDVLTKLLEAQARGETKVEIDGIKISYVDEEDTWAVVENEITEEYEPKDTAYVKAPFTWTDYYRLDTELPSGWSVDRWHSGGSGSGPLCISKDASMAVWYWAALYSGMKEDFLQYKEPYKILSSYAATALKNQEHGEFHETIYANHRALWCWANIDGQEGLQECLFVFLHTEKVVICLQAWCPGYSLSKQLVGIAVHSLNHMTITDIQPAELS